MELFNNFFLCAATVLSILVGSIYLIFRKQRKLTSPVPSSDTSLRSLNDIFLREYKLARADFLIEELEPTIILKGDSLILLYNGKRIENPNGILPLYHDLKSVAHIPLTVFNLIRNLIRHPEHLSAAHAYLIELYEIRNQLSKLFPDQEQCNVQRDIITKSIELLLRVINTPNIRNQNDELIPVFRSFQQGFLSNITTVAQSQLSSMHTIVTGWIAEYQIDVSQLRVMIVGGRGERRDNLPATYFERLLGKDGNRRIVYVEELFEDETRAKNIFASWFLNENISRVFFGDDDIERLNKDVLMNDNTRTHIHQLFQDGN